MLFWKAKAVTAGVMAYAAACNIYHSDNFR